MTMIERVIQALATYTCDAGTDKGGRTFWTVRAGQETAFKSRDYETARAECARLNARAAIAAMREPTREMANAIDAAGRDPGLIVSNWYRMIDAALAEP